MDIGKAFSFFTEDERWLEKIGIGVGVVLISGILTAGIAGYLIIPGYCLRLMKNVRDGNPTPLPDWDQWGDDLVRGLKLAVVTFGWGLPIVLVAIPLVFGIGLANMGDSAEAIGVMILLCGICLTMLYALLMQIAAPGYTIAFAKDEEIRSGLRLSAVLQWTRTNLTQVLVVTIVYLAGSFVIGLGALIVGPLACIVGLVLTIPFALFYSMLVQYHMFGQLMREAPLDPPAMVAAKVENPIVAVTPAE